MEHKALLVECFPDPGDPRLPVVRGASRHPGRIKELGPRSSQRLRLIHRRIGLSEQSAAASSLACVGRSEIAIPMLAVITNDRPSSWMGDSRRAAIRVATVIAPSTPASSGSSTTNSSPPSRDTLSIGRTAANSRSENWRRTRSPAAWPRESLMSLKQSRSTNSTPVALPERLSSASDWVSRSISRVRFGRPVSVSCVACVVSAACACSSSSMRAACARPSRSISRSCACCCVRSANVRQRISLESTSRLDTLIRAGTNAPAPPCRTVSIVPAHPAAFADRS